ncbi:hypothetical protein JCM18899A_08450 [Nocardioides sp. AN3]
MTWWLIVIAVVVGAAWAGWYIFAFSLDRRRNRDVATDRERLDVHPQGPTSTPREQQEGQRRGGDV